MLKKIPKTNVLCLIVILCSVHTSLYAQLSDRKNNIQLYGTGLSYKGELGSKFWKEYSVGGGFSYNRYLSPSFDASLHLNYGPSESKHEDGDYFKNKVGMGLVGLRLKMYGTILNEKFFIGPYLSIAAGAMHVKAKGLIEGADFKDDFVTAAVAPGAGFRVQFTEGLSAFSEVNYILTGNDEFDGLVASDNDSFLQYKLGLGYNLGKSKDSDEDGVSDRKDKCPDTPKGVQVDKDGCPVDTDGDGVADYQDKCPNEAGIATLGGCPDRDGDGVTDKKDECPDEAGSVATSGCPDTDGDGVANNVDECPDTPSGVQVGPNGCTIDTDGDGVADDEDRCPNSPGTIENKGCPEIDDKTLKLLEEKARFEFDQASVQEAYKGLLDSIVVVLAKYPDHILTIKGHADHVGSAEYNQVLSEKRAQAVKDYLIERGVQNPDRLVVKGFGETQPLVKVDERRPKNRTEKERAQNRRVGFELNTPDMKLNME